MNTMRRAIGAAVLSMVTGCAASGADAEGDRAAEAVACSATTDWVAGKWYATGAVVRYKGAYYVAEHDNPGYDPTVSTWFWDPTTCTSGSSSGGSCSAKDWAAGTWYTTGTVVRFHGSYYIAEHDNPGYDPTVSTWFWDPTTCGGGGATTPPPSSSGGGSCSAKDWAAGTWYTTGTVVRFNGSYYIAEHDNPGYDPTISTWFWDPTTCGGSSGSSGGSSSGGGVTPPPASGGTALESILSKATFEAMFPGRNGFYTYEGLVEATKKYPAFASTGSADARKREVAAFLANVNHETGALVYVEEIAKADYTSWSSAGCAPEPGKRYYGRGPLQLSWNYNYCTASASIFGDKEVLRRDPDRVAREAWVAWATGIWYWMTSNGPGSMTCHDAMSYDRGFGETIRSINGSLECGGARPDAVSSRVNAYLRFCSMLGVSPGGSTGC